VRFDRLILNFVYAFDRGLDHSLEQSGFEYPALSWKLITFVQIIQ